MGLYHSLNIEVAEMCGCHAALLLNAIMHWTMYKETNGLDEHDGKYWSYNSMEAWQTHFPYLSIKQIRVGLDKLQDEGLIVTGNYNKIPFDRTLWYALTDKAKKVLGYSIGQNRTIDLPYRTNESCHMGQISVATEDEPIPYIPNNTNNTICSEQSSSHNILLKDGSYYNVPLEDIEKYKITYPDKDVEQELLRMSLWCESNPTKLKTARGIKKFINSWLLRKDFTSERANTSTNSAPAQEDFSKWHR